MVSIIKKHLLKYKTILDLGCGSGLYGKFLSKDGAMVVGFDYDDVLCDESRKRNSYDRVFCNDIMI